MTHLLNGFVWLSRSSKPKQVSLFSPRSVLAWPFSSCSLATSKTTDYSTTFESVWFLLKPISNARLNPAMERGRFLSVRDVNTSTTVEAIKQRFSEHLHFTVGKDRFTAHIHDYFFVLARTAQDHLMKKWIRTQQHYYNQDPKVSLPHCRVPGKIDSWILYCSTFCVAHVYFPAGTGFYDVSKSPLCGKDRHVKSAARSGPVHVRSESWTRTKGPVNFSRQILLVRTRSEPGPDRYIVKC